MIYEKDYHGWNSLILATEKVELVIPTEIGPRVVSAAFKGAENLFAQQKEDLGGKGESDWRIRGGHRLWHAPEQPGRTYVPDNTPVEVERETDGSGLLLIQDTEQTTGLQKKLRLDIVDETTIRATHTLLNHGAWPIETAPWALSVMRHGGYAVVPLPPKRSHSDALLPSTVFVPWDYTDFSRPEWQFHHEFIGIDVAQAKVPQKLGLSNFPGWAAYWQEAGTFVVHSQVNPYAEYPDKGSCFEAFCCDWMIELETLAPLSTIEPGDSVQHVEHWGFFKDLPKPDSDGAFSDHLAPAVNSWLDRSVR